MVTADAKIRFVREQIVLPDGRTVGEAMTGDPWIERDLLGPAFELQPSGLPRYSLVDNELARGHWKSGGAAAIALAEAVLEPGTDIVIASGDTEQAGIILGQFDGYCDRNPAIGSLLSKRGNERLFEGGSRIRVISSDAPTAWGLGGTHRRFRVICDEVTVWKSVDLWEALVSATGKVADTQTIILSNAGFDAQTSWQWKVREAARTESWGHLFAPAGVIASWVTPEWIETMRALLPPAAFERVIMNVWTTGSGDFVTREQWSACVDERLTRRSSGTGDYFAGLDLGLTKDRTANAIVHRDGDEVVLDALDVWQGTKAEPISITMIERAILDASRRFPGLRVSADPWQLKGSIERLRRERVRIDEFVFSSSSVQHLSTTLYGAISSASLRVPPIPELDSEILGLRVVETSSGWRFDHRTGGYSDRAVALAMAIQLALQKPERGPGRILEPLGQIGDMVMGRGDALLPTVAAARRPTLEEEMWSAGVFAHDSNPSYLRDIRRGRS